MHSLINRINKELQQVPAAIKTFLLRGLLVLIVWKLAYLFYLGPTAVLDLPLTRTVAQQTTMVLNFFSSTHPYSWVQEPKAIKAEPDELGPPTDTSIFNQQQRVLVIADACNALELFVLYAGFILCFPASWKRKLLFLIPGLLLIHVVNIFRCVGLAYVSTYKPGILDFAHHYLFKIFIYATILVLWWFFTDKLKSERIENVSA